MGELANPGRRASWAREQDSAGTTSRGNEHLAIPGNADTILPTRRADCPSPPTSERRGSGMPYEHFRRASQSRVALMHPMSDRRDPKPSWGAHRDCAYVQEALEKEWAIQDSNLGPLPYQRSGHAAPGRLRWPSRSRIDAEQPPGEDRRRLLLPGTHDLDQSSCFPPALPKPATGIFALRQRSSFAGLSSVGGTGLEPVTSCL